MKIIIRGYGHDVDLVKGRVKGHYRHLPNGHIVYIKEHFDKRRKKAEMPGHEHRVVHADEKSTSVVGHDSKVRTYKHEPYMELDQDAIHGHLNSAMPIDDNLAFKMWKHKHKIGDYDKFLTDHIEDEKQREKPRFTNKKDAHNFFLTSKKRKDGSGIQGIRQHGAELRDKYGDVTTYAHAYTHPEHSDFREYVEHSADDEEFTNDHDRSMAQMIREHAQGAKEAAEAELEQIEKAKKLRPEDCPKIDGLSTKTELFGHQAETLAKLNVLQRAIVDVDMGGGKGLILPADAMNLMGQGKVKRPLVVVPGATLEQNASKIHEYTDGSVNVFLISNSAINEHYAGDVEKMVEDIRNAPPNTIFMASYDVFAYQDRSSDEDEVREPEFNRARVLGAAGFDYVALDEAHNIKNTQTTRFKAMKFLSRAKYKRAASGTFLSNNPLDVRGQLAFLYPQASVKEEDFKKKYGYMESPEGVQWTGLKQLREDMLNLGMISLRRSAWIDKLPERKEELAVAKMEGAHKAIYNAVLTDVVEQLEEEMQKNPRLKKFLLDDDGLGEADDLPPQALAKLGLLSGVVDYPHEMAQMMEEKLEQIKSAQKSGEVDEETVALIEQLQKMKSETRRQIRALSGIVSPKAKDVYKKLEDHFKDKKNGKYIVFVQRKAAAKHIMDNMPDKFKKMAVYYDASQRQALKDFQGEDPNSPQILVAVDASIKEGVNLQMANGMYRYDHHWSPGNQEQSYARIWRFGQNKPTKFHLGLADGSIDVPKYCRLMTKLHQNMQVVSDFEDYSPPAFKMNLATIAGKNDASIVPEFAKLNQSIIEHQREENKDLAKRFGKGTFKKSSGNKLGGKKHELRHGMGSYHSDIQAGKVKALTDKEFERLLSHFHNQHGKLGAKHMILDPSVVGTYFEDAANLLMRHKHKGGGDKLDDFTIKQYLSEWEKENGDKMTPAEVKLITGAVNDHLSGKKAKPFRQHAEEHLDSIVEKMTKKMGFRKDKEAHKVAVQDVKDMVKYLDGLKDQDKALIHVGEDDDEFGKVENAGSLDAFWKQYKKQHGEEPSNKYKKMLMGAAAVYRELGGGWKPIKYQFEDVFGLHGDEEEEE